MEDEAKPRSTGWRIFKRRWVQVLIAVGAILVLAGLLPPVRTHLTAAAAVADALGADVPRPLASSVERRTTSVGGVSGHLYTPENRAPAVMVLPGATRFGKSDPRVVRLARALTRSDRVVFVPELSLYDHVVDTADIDRIARATRALSRLRSVQTATDVVLLGASFGGSYGLIAAADPRVRGEVRLVATFGSYFDIVGLVQALSTGAFLVDGRRRTWNPNPDTNKALRQLALEMTRPSERPILRSALRGKAKPARLPDDARKVYALVTNTQPGRTRPLTSRLSARARGVLADLSPARVHERISAPVVAMHNRADDLVPHVELVRLRRNMPHATTLSVRSFEHVDLVADDLGRLAADLLTVWRFAARVHSSQNG